VTDQLQVTDETDVSRFEATVDGHTGVLEYRLDGDRLVLVHTEVPDELEGRGVGSGLVRAAVDRAEAEGLTIVPVCPFARSWLENHPEDAARVTIEPPPG
jgi:predicted GNAT family acetyltransferase